MSKFETTLGFNVDASINELKQIAKLIDIEIKPLFNYCFLMAI